MVRKELGVQEGWCGSKANCGKAMNVRYCAKYLKPMPKGKGFKILRNC